MLALYKPWRLHYDETKDSYQDFKSSLTDYMWDDNFPRSILNSILRCKLNILDEIDMEEAADMVCPETNAADGDEALAKFDHENMYHIFTPNNGEVVYETDLLDSDLSGLDKGDCTFDWSNNKDISLMDALNDYTKEYYTSRQSNITNENQFNLLDEDVYIPENCRENTQKILIFIHLFVHYQWTHIYNIPILP